MRDEKKLSIVISFVSLVIFSRMSWYAHKHDHGHEQAVSVTVRTNVAASHYLLHFTTIPNFNYMTGYAMSRQIHNSDNLSSHLISSHHFSSPQFFRMVHMLMFIESREWCYLFSSHYITRVLSHILFYIAIEVFRRGANKYAVNLYLFVHAVQ